MENERKITHRPPADKREMEISAVDPDLKGRIRLSEEKRQIALDRVDAELDLDRPFGQRRSQPLKLRELEGL